MLLPQVRELFLQHKAEQLDREMDKIRQREEAGRHVRMLTHEIRQSLDRHRILNTTLVELAQALRLENLTIWMPDASEGGGGGSSVRSEAVLSENVLFLGAVVGHAPH